MNTQSQIMLAKLRVVEIIVSKAGYVGGIDSQLVKMSAVYDDHYGPNGESENNTFARYTPTAELAMTINNPALLGKLTEGQELYVSFSEQRPRTEGIHIDTGNSDDRLLASLAAEPTPAERTEARIVETKALRRDLDAILQRIKALPDSEERFTARQRLTETVMWLGMSLKAINDEQAATAEARKAEIEAKAKEIYALQSGDPQFVPWVEGGNSLMQEKARDRAKAELGLTGVEDPYPNSKDPATGAKIDATADNLKL